MEATLEASYQSRASRFTAGEAPERTVLLFVYGTLKRGYRNAPYMCRDGVAYFGNCTTVESLPLYLDPAHRYRPCLANMRGKGLQVRGEVYRVWESLLPELDAFERVPTHYTRESISVICDSNGGLAREAFAYLNVTDDSRAFEISEGSYPLIAEYTPSHHAFYTPRDTQTTADVVVAARCRSSSGGADSTESSTTDRKTLEGETGSLCCACN
eukprot:TRINITY_DN563_c0_g1_i1.p1 TRINITY_DN563_c0_g1~~TRINITY_DN563_c0_g1_i1.p1  ORF type:complete len:213 (-),score=3.81 TRINITY_DN563_c0_g1_i1:184-822(-)